jgi:uncharacterized protein involved in exopolysaccharide biosynthesis
MATKEISKREPRFPDHDHDPDLISGAEEPRETSKAVARVALLWEHRSFLYRCAAIALVASSILVFLIPVRYTATTRLMPPDQSGTGLTSMLAALGKGSSELGAVGGELLGLKTSGDLFVGVLQSRSVQDDLVNKFDLRTVYGHSRYEDTRKELEHSTEISDDRKSGIITINVSDRSPDRAAAMGQEYVAALDRIVTSLNTSSAHKERVFLEGRLQQVQQELETAEKNFSQFASQNTAIDVKEQGKAIIGAAAQLEGQLIAAQTELEGLRQIYTPNNVRVRSLQARIDEYRHQLEKIDGKAPDSTPDANSSDQGVAAQSQELYPSIRQLPILGVTWADLYRQTKVRETVFATLTEQYELAKVEEARETPSVKVLDPAVRPERKSFPPRTFLVLLCTAFVVGLGSVWILARARWEQIDPNDPGKILAQEIAQTVRTRLRTIANRVSSRFRKANQDSPDESQH